MVKIPPAKQKSRGRTIRAAGQPAAAAALTLVAAVYEEGPQVRLTFDRPIDIASMDVSQILVDDGEVFGFRYQGVDVPELTSATTVRVPLNGISEDPDPGVHLTAGAGNGIVAVDDAAMWAGVVDLGLPYP